MPAGNDPHPNTSQALADYILKTPLAAIPGHVRRKAILCIVDTVGCLLGGAVTDLGHRIADYAVKRGGPGASRLIGRPAATSLESAVLANSTFAHILELDDGHRPSDNHLGCAVVPAALSVAEISNASGAEFLRSVIHGYDVMGRIGQAVCLPRVTSFHHSATTAVFGAAAAASVLYDLPPSQTANAIRIAATAASGLWEVSSGGVDCKALQVGRSASSGIGAVFLAQLGLQGPPKALEGTHGFVRAFSSAPRLELILSDLGSRFAVKESSFKIHAACGNLFTTIDAILALRGDLTDDIDRIEQIDVAIPPDLRADPAFGIYHPETVGAARFSVPFTAAAGILHGEVSVRQMSKEGIGDPAIARLQDKIRIVSDEEVDRIYETTKEEDYFFHPSRVTLRADGVDHTRLELSPRGYDPRRPLNEDEVVRKFLSNASAVLDPATSQAVLDQLLQIEKLENMAATRLFSP